MADTELKNFTPAAAWTSTCSVVGSDTANPTGSFFWNKAKFDLIYPQLAAANNFSATNRFKTGGFNDMSIELGSAVFGLCKYSGVSGDGILSQMGNNVVGPSLSARGVGQTNTHILAWTAGGDPMGAADTALGRPVAGVVEVNNGTPGALRDISTRNVFGDGRQMTGVEVSYLVAGIDLTAAAATVIFAVPAGKTFIATDAFLYTTTATGVVTGPQMRIINGSSNDMLNGGDTVPLGATLTNNKVFRFLQPAVASLRDSATTGTNVSLSVDTAAVATALVGTILVTGILF